LSRRIGGNIPLASVEFRILVPLDGSRDGRPTAVTAVRQRAWLAIAVAAHERGRFDRTV
jgi:hypothetical protein